MPTNSLPRSSLLSPPHTQGYGAVGIIILATFIFLLWIFAWPHLMLPGETDEKKSSRLASLPSLAHYFPLSKNVNGLGTLSGTIAPSSQTRKIIITSPLAKNGVHDNGEVAILPPPLFILIPNAEGSFAATLPVGSYGVVVEHKNGSLHCGTDVGYLSACTVSIGNNKTKHITLP